MKIGVYLISVVKWEIPAPRQRIHTLMMIELMTGSKTQVETTEVQTPQQEPEQTSEPVKIIATSGLQSKGGGRYLPPGHPDLPRFAAE